MRQPKPRLWLSASPARAIGETLLLAASLTVVLLLLAFPSDLATIGSLRTNPSLVLLDGPFCAVWCAVRLRWHSRSWWSWLLADGAVGFLIGLLPTVLVVLTLATIFARRLHTELTLQSQIGRFSIVILVAIALVASTVEFIFFRIGVRLWLIWDRLRRKHLVWSLTNAHLMVVVLAAGLLGIPLIGVNVVAFHGANALLLVPIVFFLLAVTIIAMLLVLPPSALFSYLFARRTTARLRSLTDATDALRSGDYTTRIPVTGEDEVAQLQANFNTMAVELERAVTDLQAERDTVATLLRNRRELVASVSHELRTPIATLRSYLESAREHWDGENDEPPATLRHDLEIMEREAVHLQALVDDLFALSRAEVGQLELRREPTDVLAVARRVVETMAPLAWQSSRVALLADGPETPRAALVDAVRLEQVLRNLLHNAVRHTPPGGIVAVRVDAGTEVETEHDLETVALRVTDTGEGIAPADLPHIFERFYRGENGRSRAAGAGLGLALAKELTESMGGTIAVESRPGEGSCFTLRLPVAAEAAAPAAGVALATATPVSETPTPVAEAAPR